MTCSKPKICSDVVKDLDYVYLRGFVIDDSQAYLTPVTYIMKVVDTSDKHLRCDDVVKLTSLRIRFTELGVGTYLEVKGRLQKVNDELIINLDFPDSYVKILKYEVPTLIRDLKK
ncbi:MAG TPA: hypothetical protein ENF75_03935 [Acidilobales archaeon]|nr:hypothetical protein [Acidilobales archaeon]